MINSDKSDQTFKTLGNTVVDVSQQLKSDWKTMIDDQTNRNSMINLDSNTIPNITIDNQSLIDSKKKDIIDDEEFYKQLNKELKIDIKNPLDVISKRIEARRKRMNLTFNDLNKMNLKQLTLEKKILKRELKQFEILFKEQTGNEPTRDRFVNQTKLKKNGMN